MAFKNTRLDPLSIQVPRTFYARSHRCVKYSYDVLFQTSDKEYLTRINNQPRLRKEFKDLSQSQSGYLDYLPENAVYNPLMNQLSETVTVKGTITENGAPVIGKSIMVLLLSTCGHTVEKVYTDLEGNFVFYEIPQNLSLMAVAIDHTYKYNAVILSKVMTIDNGE